MTHVYVCTRVCMLTRVYAHKYNIYSGLEEEHEITPQLD